MAMTTTASRNAQYDVLFREIRDRISSEVDPIANAANISAHIFEHLNHKIDPVRGDAPAVLNRVNWCGFYFVKPSSGQAVHHGTNTQHHNSKESVPSNFSAFQLVLGPFQGKAACIRINYGDGVCGTTWKRKESVVVPDVHKFDGHIACDDSSNSEIVVPILSKDKEVLGVLDIDSRVFANFDEVDRVNLERIVEYFVQQSPFDFRHQKH